MLLDVKDMMSAWSGEAPGSMSCDAATHRHMKTGSKNENMFLITCYSDIIDATLLHESSPN
jgi:hypothetical protein